MQTITQARAEEILHGRLLPGWRTDAKSVLNRVEKTQIVDTVAPSSAFRWTAATGGGVALSIGGEDPVSLHRNALTQAAGLADIPVAFASTLATEDPDLLAHNLTKRLTERLRSRHLVRVVGSEARAVLSNAYRRLDSRPIVDAMIGAAKATGAIPMGGTLTDTRITLRLCLPRIFEVTPGEFIMLGLQWGNSDFGRGANEFSLFVLRVVCANGAVVESAARQIHLGKRLTDDNLLSQRTLDLDSAAAASAARDLVMGYLSPAKAEERIALVKKAATETLQPGKAEEWLKKHLSKDMVEKARESYQSLDVERVPMGQTPWRLSNALSWLANDASLDAEDRLDLQVLAGKALAL